MSRKYLEYVNRYKNKRHTQECVYMRMRLLKHTEDK